MNNNPTLFDVMAAFQGVSNKVDDSHDKLTNLEKGLWATNKKLGDTVCTLSILEARVERSKRTLRDVKQVVQDEICTHVGTAVTSQLLDMGFDPNLTAADLTARSSSCGTTNRSSLSVQANNKPRRPRPLGEETIDLRTQEERREERYWDCHRMLRCWLLARQNMEEAFRKFLRERLLFDEQFIEEELGEVQFTRFRNPRSKVKDEYIVTFECKEIRDAIKAAGPSLAGVGVEAGMRIHVPNHLKRDLDVLLSLSFQMKQKHANLRRNVKMDDSNLGLVLDFCIGDGDWKRIRPDEARKAKLNQNDRSGVEEVGSKDLDELLGRISPASGANLA